MRLFHLSKPAHLPASSSPTEPPPAPDLLTLNARRIREDARVLVLLGSACALGTGLGVAGALAPKRVRTRAFFQAATGVHLFVLGTALAGLGAAKAQSLPQLGLRTTLRRSGVLQRLLWVGLGLDVATAALGTLLLRRRLQGHTAWREGAGASFLLHGLGLLIFDAGVFRRNALYHRRVAQLSRTSSGKILVVRRAEPEETHPDHDSVVSAASLGAEPLPLPDGYHRQPPTAPVPEA